MGNTLTKPAKIILFILAALVIATYIGSIQAAIKPEDAVTHSSIEVETGDPSPQDCYENGNRICGDADGVMEDAAWKAWDSLGGWKYLKVDPNRRFKVEYIGTAKVYPSLAEGEVALPSDYGYWVFRAQYLDPITVQPTV